MKPKDFWEIIQVRSRARQLARHVSHMCAPPGGELRRRRNKSTSSSARPRRGCRSNSPDVVRRFDYVIGSRRTY